MKFIERGLLFNMLLLHLVVMAQPTYLPPNGVWCSCPPTTPAGSNSVVPQVATKSYVNGILVRVSWKDLEPTENYFNWALVDNQIAAANQYQKKIALAVGGGPNSPAWLYALGVDSIHFTVPFTAAIPVPWDSVYRLKWSHLIEQLGARYHDDTTIQLVYITHSSTNGFEMQLPFNPTPTYAMLGYTDRLMIDAWKQTVQSFSAAFPNHYLTNDFHPVNSSNAVSDSVYAYAKQFIGERYGANGWWWTQHNTTVYPSQFNLLQRSTQSGLFTGIQMAYSGLTDSADFGAGGMPEALHLAVQSGICYWEIWNSDLTNGKFDSLLNATQCNKVTSEQKVAVDLTIQVYPNPSQGLFQLQFPQSTINWVQISDALGRTVFTAHHLNCETCSFDVQSLEAGLYFITLQNNQGNRYKLKLRIDP